MLKSSFSISIITWLVVGCGMARAEQVIEFGDKTYQVTGVVAAKSSSARLARLDEDLDILKKHIYLPAGTLLFLLDHFEHDPRRYQLAVSENGMPLYVLPNSNYFSANRFSSLQGEFAAVPRANIEIDTDTYGRITLTPSEVYSMEFRDHPLIAITIGREKMRSRYTEDEVVEVSEDRFAYVPLPIDDGAQPPKLTQIYDFKSVLDEILSGLSDEPEDTIQRFKDYASGRFISRKNCEDEINYGFGIDAEAAVEFDTWLSPVEAKLALSGTYKATRTYAVGTEFTIERYVINGRVYEMKDESVAENCVDLEENRRIRIATDRVAGQLNSEDASDLGLRTDPKGRIIYTCRDEYLKIEKTLHDQELRIGPARLLISRFTIYDDVGNAARCTSNN